MRGEHHCPTFLVCMFSYRFPIKIIKTPETNFTMEKVARPKIKM